MREISAKISFRKHLKHPSSNRNSNKNVNKLRFQFYGNIIFYKELKIKLKLIFYKGKCMLDSHFNFVKVCESFEEVSSVATEINQKRKYHRTQ